MKKKLMTSLLMIGFGNLLHAQTTVDNTVYRDALGNAYFLTDVTGANLQFNVPKPGNHRVNFHFDKVPGAKRITLELSTIFQMNSLPNLDSMVDKAKKDLFNVADSLAVFANSKRIDYVGGDTQQQIRITKHTDQSQTYVLLKNELADLKIDNDTLRIRFFTLKNDAISKAYEIGHITIVIKNISDIQNIPTGIMDSCSMLIKQYVRKEDLNVANTTIRRNHVYLNVFNYQNKTVSNNIKNGYVTPVGLHIGKKELVPNFYPSMQWVNGTLAANIAVGFRYRLHNSKVAKTYLYASWEPMFTATHNGGANNLVRNDFVTLRMREETNYESNKPWVSSSNVSIGYLVGRRGDFFRPNTFKIGLPAARANMLQLEPEFFFHDFLKGFSPSIKLTLFFD